MIVCRFFSMAFLGSEPINNKLQILLIQKLEESTHLLGATCDTFIATLEDCLRLAKADPYCHPPDKWFNGSHERASPTFPPSPSNSTGTKKGLKTKPVNKVTTQ